MVQFNLDVRLSVFFYRISEDGKTLTHRLNELLH